MLNIENLHAESDGKPILKGLSLTVNAGEVHAIMGPNGAAGLVADRFVGLFCGEPAAR